MIKITLDKKQTAVKNQRLKVHEKNTSREPA